jgi:hypothetical protein
MFSNANMDNRVSNTELVGHNNANNNFFIGYHVRHHPTHITVVVII